MNNFAVSGSPYYLLCLLYSSSFCLSCSFSFVLFHIPLSVCISSFTDSLFSPTSCCFFLPKLRLSSNPRNKPIEALPKRKRTLCLSRCLDPFPVHSFIEFYLLFPLPSLLILPGILFSSSPFFSLIFYSPLRFGIG